MNPRATVIGWPVAHSRSPLIHSFWLRSLRLSGSYGKAAVAPEELATYLGQLSHAGIVGGNVTVPHKEAAAVLCHHLGETARRLGAVNTLWLEDGRLCGDNTDGLGFLAALDQDSPGWEGGGGCALVLGAGGAARAIVDALLARGMARVVVANRSLERAEKLAALLGDRRVQAVDLRTAESEARGADLLVNTTSAGMAGQDRLDFSLAALPDRAVVDDIVYVPRDTPLLREATARGLRTVGGLGMLLHQAVPGFERWFGVRPEVTPALRAMIEADIAGSA